MDQATREKHWLLLIDMDDTLLPNAYLFVESAMQSALIITRALGPRTPFPRELFTHQHEVDVQLLPQYGYGTGRYAESWTRTYHHFAQQCGVAVDPRAEAAIAEAAMGFTRGPFPLYDGVNDTLKTLRRAGHKLQLVTTGPDDLQSRKIRSSGIRPHFHGISISQRPKQEVFEELAGKRRQRVMVIGDSMRRDVAAAVSLGIKAAHVPGDSWAHSSSVEVPESDFHQLRNFNDLPALLLKLESTGDLEGKPKKR